MTNEEIAQAVKAGEPEAPLLLWEAVGKFVAMQARRYARAYNLTATRRIEAEDLTQAGFVATLEAAQQYDPEQGHSFLQVLSYALKTAFSQEAGTRTKKRDALQYSSSLDAKVFDDEADSPAEWALVPDEAAALAFVGVEYRDFLRYCRNVIAAALDGLSEQQAAVIRLHYLDGVDLDTAAERVGMEGRAAAYTSAEQGLYQLASGKHRRALRDCLTAFDDFRQYQTAARGAWGSTGISRTEAAALVHMGG